MSLESDGKMEAAKVAAKKGATWAFRAVLVSAVFTALYIASQ